MLLLVMADDAGWEFVKDQAVAMPALEILQASKDLDNGRAIASQPYGWPYCCAT